MKHICSIFEDLWKVPKEPCNPMKDHLHHYAPLEHLYGPLKVSQCFPISVEFSDACKRCLQLHWGSQEPIVLSFFHLSLLKEPKTCLAVTCSGRSRTSSVTSRPSSRNLKTDSNLVIQPCPHCCPSTDPVGGACSNHKIVSCSTPSVQLVVCFSACCFAVDSRGTFVEMRGCIGRFAGSCACTI